MHRLVGPVFGRRLGVSAIVVLTLGMLAGCAATPEPPTALLKAASDTIDDAERANARQYAGSELDQAQDKLRRAKVAVESGDMLEAEHLAQQARVTAELAMARTDAARASEINRQLRQDADALEEEMKRTGDHR